VYKYVCPKCGYVNYREVIVPKVRCTRCDRVFTGEPKFCGDDSEAKKRKRAFRRCERCGSRMNRLTVMKKPAGWICFGCGNIVLEKWVYERIGKEVVE